MVEQRIARLVPTLAPETLQQLVRQRGLDVCAEILALATPAQLASVLDLDLWQSAAPGQDACFDADRFGEWLELLVEAGSDVAVRVVAAMDEHLFVAGLSRFVRVVDPAALAAIVDGERLDAVPHHGPECEVGGYLVRGLTAAGWDAIVALLIALDAENPARFHAVMNGCRRLSSSRPEVDGLDDLLMEPEQLLHDVAAARDERRTRQGYATPADARAFLQMARQRQPSSPSPDRNPIVTAYFRAAADGPKRSDASNGPVERLDLLAEALGLPAQTVDRPRALLDGVRSHAPPFARLRSLMDFVSERDEAAYADRSQELAFLVNTLAAGCSMQSRSFTPQEASDAAAAVCNLALERWPRLSESFLLDHDLVSVFETGWATLHQQVSLYVADQLLAALAGVQSSDEDVQHGLETLRFELTKQRDAGTPWLARDALDTMATLDVTAWVAVLALLDEYPVLPAAMTATLEGRTGAVSATEFEFISTEQQLDMVRAFMARFPDILFR